MRLIDADKIKLPQGFFEKVDNVPKFYEWLDEQPTVDAVQVVRCKDCKYYLSSNEKCQLIDTRLHFYEEDKRWAEDSFCSWAERKEE